MSNVDNSLQRMAFLMNYKMNESATNQKRSSNIEYVTEGADGRMYGILKEGTKYYVKVAEKGLEDSAKNYDYVDGFLHRNLNEAASYNEATKKLEFKLMSLNEAMGTDKKTSTVDFKRGEKALNFLTEEARKAIDRAKQIFENSNTIGKNNTGTPEAPATASDPTKQGDPFEENVKATLDKDPKLTGTVEKASKDLDYKEIKDAEAKLTSDKDPKADAEHAELDNKVKDSDVSSEGKSVAIKEDVVEPDGEVDPGDEEDEMAYVDSYNNGEDEEPVVDDPAANDDDAAAAAAMSTDMSDEELLNKLNLSPEDFEEEEPVYDEPYEFDGGEVAGLDLYEEEDAEACGASKDCACDNTSEDEALVGPHGNGQAISMDRLEETVDDICESILNEVKVNPEDFEDEDGPKGEKKQKMNADKKIGKFHKNKGLNEAKLANVIKKMVAEELNVWGKHPRYGKEPFSTPDNKEVLAGTAEKDWNDDSVKHDTQYGKKIGDSKPFDKKVEMLTDQVVKLIKESLKKKK